MFRSSSTTLIAWLRVALLGVCLLGAAGRAAAAPLLLDERAAIAL